MAAKKIRLTDSQTRVLSQILDFIDARGERVFILKGYAGTGKTTLLRFLLKELKKRNLPVHLMAPTGRAAKVMSNLAGDGGNNPIARTIHSYIYSFKGLNKNIDEKESPTFDTDGQLFLEFEAGERACDESGDKVVHIIDEASMVSDFEQKEVSQAKFGSGRLLNDLLSYDLRSKSKYIFVGDPCQLPPVEQQQSPALNAAYFATHYHMRVCEAQLTEIMRQTDTSSLITASKKVRVLYQNAPESAAVYGRGTVWGKLPFRAMPDIHWHVDAGDLVRHYIGQVKRAGLESAIFICRSNAKCQQFNLSIRPMLGITSSSVAVGDMLMVTQNNLLVPLVNGDMVQVTEVTDQVSHCCDLQYRLVTVRELFTGKLHKTWLLEDILYCGQPNLDKVRQSNLMYDFVVRMRRQGIKQGSNTFNTMMRTDVYLNALRCNFGYAVTCHKAQGGEWDTVYVDMPRNITMNPVKEKYQWVYTAMTRASRSLHLVNDFFYE